jgi:hypothetical protein
MYLLLLGFVGTDEVPMSHRSYAYVLHNLVQEQIHSISYKCVSQVQNVDSTANNSSMAFPVINEHSGEII